MSVRGSSRVRTLVAPVAAVDDVWSAATWAVAAAVGTVAATSIVAGKRCELRRGEGGGGRGGKKDKSCVLLAVVEGGEGVVAGPWARFEVGGNVAEVPGVCCCWWWWWW